MVIIDLEYIEIDGLLYPNIEIGGSEGLNTLGKYGRLRLEYLHGFKQEMYRELLFSGKLAEHCATVDMRNRNLTPCGIQHQIAMAYKSIITPCNVIKLSITPHKCLRSGKAFL